MSTATSNIRFVIHHPQMGIYLGNALGLGFWTKIDTVGQDSAVTFESTKQAEEHMATWDQGRPTEATIQQFCADKGYYASASACAAAGLEPWVV